MSLFEAYETHIQRIDTGVQEVGIDRADLAMMDHVCYRVETQARYEEVKRQLGEVALLKGASLVAGREIAIFALHEPLEAAGWRVPYVELPAPKDGSPYPEGLEHAEFVVNGELETFRQKYAHLGLDEKAYDRPLNPELSLKTATFAAKFHKLPIGAVVDIEQALEQGRLTA